MIVIADDFGLSEEVNAAIVEAFDRGLLTGASIIANMPAFEEACELAAEHGFQDRVGTHLNLTEGTPLTEPIKSYSRFSDGQGRFRYWRHADYAFRLNRAEWAAVRGELRAQIMRCRENGIPVSHLDSHNHVHNKRAIGRILISLALELEIPRVRLAHNCGSHTHLAARAYHTWFVNRSLRRMGLAGTRWYGGTEDYRHLERSGVPAESLKSFELSTHPGFENGVLVDWLAQPVRPLEDVLRELDPSGQPRRSARAAS